MNTPDDFSQYHAELLDGIYDCVDRIVLNAFFPYLILRDKVIKPLLAGVVRPFGRPPNNQPRSINTTSGSARNSTEPFKPSALRPLEKVATQRQHVGVRCSISV